MKKIMFLSPLLALILVSSCSAKKAVSSDVVLSSNLEDNIILSGEGNYKSGTSVSVSSDAHLGYLFKGWQLNNKIVSIDENYEFKMPRKNVNLKAIYEVDENISNLVYESDFDHCIVSSVKDKDLSNLVIPQYVTKIEEGALKGCANLTSISIPFIGGENKEPMGGIKYPFGYIFGNESYEGGVNTFQHYYNSYMDGGTSYGYINSYNGYIPSNLKEITLTNPTTITAYAFMNMEINRLTISNRLVYVDELAFANTSIDKIYYKGDIGDICSVNGYYNSIFNVDANSFYININNEYQEFPEDLVIPKTVEEINYSAFKDNTIIKTVEFGPNVKKIKGDAFDYTNITDVYFNGTLDDWCKIEFEYGGNPISCDYDKTTHKLIPRNLYLLDKKGNVKHNGKKYKKVEGEITLNYIGDYIFSNASNITIVRLSSSITSIPEDAFSGSSITEIYIPSSVTEIDEYAFYDCDDLIIIHNLSNVILDKDTYHLPDDVQILNK